MWLESPSKMGVSIPDQRCWFVQAQRDVDDVLNEFTKKKPNLEKKDINQYKTPDELVATLEATPLSKKQKQRMLQDMRNVEGADTLFQNDEWTVYSPKTYEASCALRKGASWCTGSTTDDHWYNHYTKNGKLYIIINNDKPKEKYQLYVENGKRSAKEFRDSHNGMVKFSQFIQEHPALGEVFYDKDIIHFLKPGEKSDNPKINALAEYLDCSVNDIFEGISSEWFDTPEGEYLVLTDDEADEYAMDLVVEYLQATTEEDKFLFNYLPESAPAEICREITDYFGNLMFEEEDPEFGNKLVEYLYGEGKLDDDDLEKMEDGTRDYYISKERLLDLYNESVLDNYRGNEYDCVYDYIVREAEFSPINLSQVIDRYYDSIDYTRAASDMLDYGYYGDCDRGAWISGFNGQEIELNDGYFAYEMG